ncbi:MAG: hypothetical protein KDD42_08905, partial [Bdellovibrionales bacterium]|nr:hypothetical protein [Bdellovibrionales bacterium]
MKILLFNQCWFPEELREGGHEVITCGFDSRFDVVLQHPLIRLTEILKVLPKSFNPEVIVVFDNSLPLLILGIEDSPIPTVFYSVDVH